MLTDDCFSQIRLHRPETSLTDRPGFRYRQWQAVLMKDTQRTAGAGQAAAFLVAGVRKVVFRGGPLFLKRAWRWCFLMGF